MYNPFTKHPNKINETYLQHMWCALKFSFKLEYLSFIALTHAIFPFLYETKVSDGVKELNDCMQNRRENEQK